MFPTSATTSRRKNRGQAHDPASFVFQEISTLQEEALRKWLSQMGFDVPYGETVPGNSSAGERIVTQDPLRNGTLLCALVQMLDPDHGQQILSRVVRNPLSVKQASKNVHIALKVLRSRRYSAIPAPYLHQPEAIVKGHRAVLWGLLWHMKRTIDTFVPDPSELHSIAGRTPSGKAVLRQRSGGGGGSRGNSSTRRVSFFDQTSSGVHTGIKSKGDTLSRRMASNALDSAPKEHFYTRQESWQLERSLLSWLFSIGSLSKCHPSFVGGVPHDLTDIEEALRNGTLLCVVAEIITLDAVRGWMKKPKTSKVGRKNVEKALELLRITDGFGQRFTWKGDDMHRGSRHDILGVLEDCHRYQDGLTPRTKFYHLPGSDGNVGSEDDGRPYFGSHVPDPADMELPQPNYSYPRFDTPGAYIIGRGSHLGMGSATGGGGGGAASFGVSSGIVSSSTSMYDGSTRGGRGGGTTLDFNSAASFVSNRGGLNNSSAARGSDVGTVRRTQSSMAASTRSILIAGGTTNGANNLVEEGGGNATTTETVTRSALAASAVAASRSIPLIPSPKGVNNVAGSSSSSSSSGFYVSSQRDISNERGRVAPRDSSSSSFRQRDQPSQQHHAYQSPSSATTSRIHPFNQMSTSLSSSTSSAAAPRYVSQVSAVASTSSLIQDLSMQRDASNDIIPLPGARDVHEGRIPMASGVGPEHSMHSVHEANARHMDVVRAMRDINITSRNQDMYPSEKGTAQDVVSWMKSLGVHLLRARDLETNVAPEFSDGVKLCMLVQKCELMRGAIPGVNIEPKNQAQVRCFSMVALTVDC